MDGIYGAEEWSDYETGSGECIAIPTERCSAEILHCFTVEDEDTCFAPRELECRLSSKKTSLVNLASD